MLLALEGVAGAGKSTLRDALLLRLADQQIPVGHVGQFSWLSLTATRTLVDLRSGHATVNAAAALEAAHTDLTLHARFNIRIAATAGHVIADRHVLSTAALLALQYQRPPREFLTRLADVPGSRPDITVLLTTPVAACTSRVAARPTAARHHEHPDTAAQLADLYTAAAEDWHQLTGATVLYHPSAVPADTQHLLNVCSELLATAPVPIPGVAE